MDGHFPGNPVVPGAVIVAYLAHSLTRTRVQLTSISRMKFLRPLLPNVPFEISVSGTAGSAKAEFRDAEGLYATARLVLAPVDD